LKLTPLVSVSVFALALAAAVSTSEAGPGPNRQETRLNALRPAGAAARQGQVLVRFKAGASPRERSAAHARTRGSSAYRSPGTGWEVVTLAPGADPRAAVDRYRLHPAVEAAEYALYRTITKIPKDLRKEQWGLHNTGQSVFGHVGTADADIDAPEAWDLARGSKQIIVAVLDTGIDHSRGDLSGRLVDGDDFVNNDGSADDDNGHGTAVASVIGAVGGNGKGMVGVSWKVSLMPVKVCSGQGDCPPGAVLAGIDFAVNNGADVINMSFSCDEHFNPQFSCPGVTTPGDCFSQAERDAIQSALNAGVVVVSAAGNCAGNNDDSSTSYPCAHNLEANICVGASAMDDRTAYFSNFGTQAVDIGAPGELILTLARTPPGGFFLFDGTSFSSPMTAGVAALLMSRTPMTPEAVRKRIVEDADTGVNLDSDFEGGRLNAFKAIREVFLNGRIYSTEPPGTGPTLLADVTGDGRADLILARSGTGFDVAKNVGKKRKFRASRPWSATAPAGIVLAADVDGDLLADVILGDSNGFRVLRSGKSAFLPVESWNGSQAGAFALAGDVNGDARADLVNFSGTFDVLLSTGSGFGSPQTWNSETQATFTGLVDATGDGRADLIHWSNTGSATEIKVSISSGASFASGAPWVTSDEFDFAGAADFDGDGDGDLLGVDSSNGCLAVFTSTGSSFAEPRIWTCPGAAGHILPGAAGKRRDGRDDVVIRHTATSSWQLLESQP
jgi:subtilisin family serine protease